MMADKENTPKCLIKKPISESRKIRKPLMEKKRRERINASLSALAELLKEANKVMVDEDKPSKLEKADILEMTVQHLQSLSRNSFGASDAEEHSKSEKYQEGFKHCLKVVEKIINDSISDDIKKKLLSHLQSRLKKMYLIKGSTLVNENNKENQQIMSNQSGCHDEPKDGLSKPATLTLVPKQLDNGKLVFTLGGNSKTLLRQLNTLRSSDGTEASSPHHTSPLSEISIPATRIKSPIGSSSEPFNSTFPSSSSSLVHVQTYSSTMQDDTEDECFQMALDLPPSSLFKAPSLPSLRNTSKPKCPPTPPPSPPTHSIHRSTPLHSSPSLLQASHSSHIPCITHSCLSHHSKSQYTYQHPYSNDFSSPLPVTQSSHSTDSSVFPHSTQSSKSSNTFQSLHSTQTPCIHHSSQSSDNPHKHQPFHSTHSSIYPHSNRPFNHPRLSFPHSSNHIHSPRPLQSNVFHDNEGQPGSMRPRCQQEQPFDLSLSKMWRPW